MTNSKQKPAPEGTKRSPGKSKFSIPKKEAPPIDGSYLERLFADYDKQTKEQQTGSGVAATSDAEPLEPPALVRQPVPEVSEEKAPAAAPELTQPPAQHALQPVPFPVEEKVDQDGPAEEASAAEQGVTTPSAPREVLPTTLVPQAPPPPAEAAAGDSEIIQYLVKLHRLSKGEAAVLRVMLRMCRESGSDVCYIKIPQLMAATGLKDRQTQRVLKSLAGLKLIERLAEYSNADRLGIKYRVHTSRP